MSDRNAPPKYMRLKEYATSRGFGVTKAYEMIRDARLVSIKLDAMRLVDVAASDARIAMSSDEPAM